MRPINRHRFRGTQGRGTQMTILVGYGTMKTAFFAFDQILIFLAQRHGPLYSRLELMEMCFDRMAEYVTLPRH